MQWKRQVIFNEQGFIAVIFYYAQESAPPAQRPLATLQAVIRGQWKGGGGAGCGVAGRKGTGTGSIWRELESTLATSVNHSTEHCTFGSVFLLPLYIWQHSGGIHPVPMNQKTALSINLYVRFLSGF